MAKKKQAAEARSAGVVRSFAPDAGQRVRFTYERPGFLQDGCPYRALVVRPEP